MSAGRPLPDFAIVGVARGGTTALADLLARHPRVGMCHPKEPHHLAFAGCRPDFRGPHDARFNAQVLFRRPDYLAALRAAGGDVVGEASTSSFHLWGRALPAIEELNPAMRVVVLLRDPVERALSGYDYMVSRRQETLGVGAALDAEAARTEAGWRPIFHYAAQSRYHAALAAHLEHLGPERCLVLYSEDLRSDPGEVWRRVVGFLGLEPGPLPPGPGDLNASGRLRASPAAGALASVRETAVGDRVAAHLPRSLGRAVRRRLLRPVDDTPDRRAVRARLRRELHADLQATVELLRATGHRRPPWASLEGGDRVADGADSADSTDSADREGRR